LTKVAVHSRARRVLIASDDEELNGALARLLEEYSPIVSDDGTSEAILREAQRHDGVRLVLVASSSASAEALDALQTVRRERADLAVLVLSRHPTIGAAAESIRRGAEDFVPVPYSDEIVCKEVARILEAAELRDRVEHLNRLVASQYGFDRVVSGSPLMRAVFDRGNAAARSDTPVLLIGETGTGKELIARAIHANSRRAKRAFVPINCAALPHDLVESELFGHRRGAFSGATTDHPGLFVAAHDGTLFLDEVSELPPAAQAKLLRVLQNGEVRPVGGLESRRVDVRIIAATNRSLVDLRDRDMRQDLFFRLSVLVIQIPPLRERREDMPLLAAHFLAAARARGATRCTDLNPDALELLAGYRFPGNVRELENMIEGLIVTLPPGRMTIHADDVAAWLQRRGIGAMPHTFDATDMPLQLSALEAWAITEALRRAQGNKTAAAHTLGISRDTLYRKLHELGLVAEASEKRAPSESLTERPTR
jgi:DNA-binding NtrC family response regulator